MNKLATLIAGLATLLVSGPAVAHPGDHAFSGFAEGIEHLLGHADHILMLIVAIAVAALVTRPGLRTRVAALLKRRSR
jgi:hydrogenase/urease accessory protein HupE